MKSSIEVHDGTHSLGEIWVTADTSFGSLNRQTGSGAPIPSKQIF